MVEHPLGELGARRPRVRHEQVFVQDLSACPFLGVGLHERLVVHLQRSPLLVVLIVRIGEMGVMVHEVVAQVPPAVRIGTFAGSKSGGTADRRPGSSCVKSLAPCMDDIHGTVPQCGNIRSGHCPFFISPSSSNTCLSKSRLKSMRSSRRRSCARTTGVRI